MAYFRYQMAMKAIVIEIKLDEEGKVTNIRRNDALETHVSKAQSCYSLSATATRDTNPVAEVLSFSPVAPQNVVGVNLDLRLEGKQSR